MKVQTLEKPKLDLMRLNQAICSYRNTYLYPNEPYIICSKDTQTLLDEQIIPFYNECRCKGIPGGLIAQFEGYKVLTDETLPLGEFEIR